MWFAVNMVGGCVEGMKKVCKHPPNDVLSYYYGLCTITVDVDEDYFCYFLVDLFAKKKDCSYLWTQNKKWNEKNCSRMA